jgi:thymidylate synthase ThyX
MIKSEIIADSIDNKGKRITSFIVTIPRIILAELNTHRVLSRNSASSRAIPFVKMLDAVKTNPFIPIAWMKDHSGMQGNEFFTEEGQIKALEEAYLAGRDNAVKTAESLSNLGLTKQIVNRGLEAYMWHTVILTSTELENFFALRAHEAAEIHIQKLAYLMLEEMNNTIPKLLQNGEWHIPFGDKMNETELEKLMPVVQPDSLNWHEEHIQLLKVKVAVARCARVSYTIVGEEGKPDNYGNDIKLHDRLMSMGHLSPFEHCAQATEDTGWSGNFQGWTQYRKTLPNENRNDNRLSKIIATVNKTS